MPSYTLRERRRRADGQTLDWVEGVTDDGWPFVGWENPDGTTGETLAVEEAAKAVAVADATSKLPGLLASAVTSGTVVGLVEALKVVLG